MRVPGNRQESNESFISSAFISIFHLFPNLFQQGVFFVSVSHSDDDFVKTIHLLSDLWTWNGLCFTSSVQQPGFGLTATCCTSAGFPWNLWLIFLFLGETLCIIQPHPANKSWSLVVKLFRFQFYSFQSFFYSWWKLFDHMTQMSSWLVSLFCDVLIWCLFSVLWLSDLTLTVVKPQDRWLEGKAPWWKPSQCQRNASVSGSPTEVKEHRCDSGVTAAWNFAQCCSQMRVLSSPWL